MKTTRKAKQGKASGGRQAGSNQKRAGGRPSLYREEFAEQAKKLCRLGATDKELAEFFDVSEATLNTWKKEHAEFLESLKSGKSIADAEVADRLYQRAIGYSHAEDKIMQHLGKPIVVPTVKHYAPDTVACIFWLKNRRPDLWREKVALEHSGPDGGPIPSGEGYKVTAEDEEVIRRIAETRAKLKQDQNPAGEPEEVEE